MPSTVVKLYMILVTDIPVWYEIRLLKFFCLLHILRKAMEHPASCGTVHPAQSLCKDPQDYTGWHWMD